MLTFRSLSRGLLSRGAAAVLLTLAEEARQLGGDRVTGRDIELRAELVHALLELLHVGLRVRVGGDRFGDLLAVALDGLLELAGVDGGAQELAEPLAEGERRARARRQGDVVRHGSPEADR